jgi:hypothetical protein
VTAAKIFGSPELGIFLDSEEAYYDEIFRVMS